MVRLIAQGTVKARLMSLSYHSPEAFESDVQLMFTNAITSYPESRWVKKWVPILRKEFGVSLCVSVVSGELRRKLSSDNTF